MKKVTKGLLKKTLFLSALTAVVLLFITLRAGSQPQLQQGQSGTKPPSADICAEKHTKWPDRNLNITFDCGGNPCRVICPAELPKYLKEGTAITVVYKNVNPFAVSSNLSGVFSSANFNDGGDALQKIATSLSAVTKQGDTPTAPANIAVAEQAIDPKTLVNKKNRIDLVKAQQLKQKQVDSAQQKKQDDLQKLIGEKKYLLRKIAKSQQEISGAAIVIRNITGLGAVIQNAMKDANIHDSAAFINRINNNRRYAITSTTNIVADFNTQLQNIKSGITSIELDIKQLTDISRKIKAISADNAFDDQLAELTDAVKQLDNVYNDSTNNDVLTQKVNTIDSLYSAVSSISFTIPGRTTFFINDDELVLSDSLLLPNGALYRKINNYRFVSYRGTRIDYAIGLAVTTGNVNASSYFINRDKDGKATGLGESRKNSIGNFSPIAFVHFTIKSASVLSPAISIGLNPDFSTVGNSKLLIGFSGAFTESKSFLKRFVLSAGIATGLTDVLKAKYYGITTDNADQLLSSLSDGDLTEKSLRFGGFFGVSFNLGQIK